MDRSETVTRKDRNGYSAVEPFEDLSNEHLNTSANRLPLKAGETEFGGPREKTIVDLHNRPENRFNNGLRKGSIDRSISQVVVVPGNCKIRETEGPFLKLEVKKAKYHVKSNEPHNTLKVIENSHEHIIASPEINDESPKTTIKSPEANGESPKSKAKSNEIRDKFLAFDRKSHLGSFTSHFESNDVQLDPVDSILDVAKVQPIQSGKKDDILTAPFQVSSSIEEEEMPAKKTKKSEKARAVSPLYSVEENPPLGLALMLAFQHFLTMLGACLTTPLTIAPALCIMDNPHASAKILAALFIGCGISTFVQSTLGIRLAVVEGGSLAHLVPVLAILTLDGNQCTAEDPGDLSVNRTYLSTTMLSCNTTLEDCITDDGNNGTVFGENEKFGGGGTPWQDRMREIQGALILSTMLEIFIGFFGLVGVLIRFIGPLSIAPTVSLLGISLFETAADYCSANWWIAFLTIALIGIFSEYLRDVNVPCIGYKDGRIYRVSFKLFSLFPVVLSITISWILCLILTETNAIPNDKSHWAYKTRTDVQSRVLTESPWFDVPYPFHLGMPIFSAGSVLGMFSGILGAIMEAIGAFYTCARLSGAPPPPIHAINRGIFIEGIGNIVNGMLGSGVGLTIFSENVASVGITQVASRRVIQLTALLLIIFGVLGKITALFVSIPPPVVGGVFMTMFGVITAVGVSNLQFVNLNSTRNLFVFGCPFLLGLALPEWLKKHPGAINTGVQFLDQMITVLGRTPMFVGGSIAIFLDNTIPGTNEERGLAAWMAAQSQGSTGEENAEPESTTLEHSIYDLPHIPFCSGWLRNIKWLRFLPICPSFTGYDYLRKLFRRCTKKMPTLRRPKKPNSENGSAGQGRQSQNGSVKVEASNGGVVSDDNGEISITVDVMENNEDFTFSSSPYVRDAPVEIDDHKSRVNGDPSSFHENQSYRNDGITYEAKNGEFAQDRGTTAVHLDSVKEDRFNRSEYVKDKEQNGGVVHIAEDSFTANPRFNDDSQRIGGLKTDESGEEILSIIVDGNNPAEADSGKTVTHV